MVDKQTLDAIHQAVPKDYYQKGIKKNILQKIWHKNRFRLINQKLNNLKLTGKLLDIGCHSGDLTSIIAQTTKGSTYGLDLSAQAISYAQLRFPQINFRRLDFSRGTDFPANYFQAVTAFDVLEHIPNLKETLIEIKRIIIPGGYLIVGVPNENLLFKVVWFFWTKIKGQVWKNIHVQDFKNQQTYSLFEQQGFSKLEEKKIILNMWRFLIFRKD